MSEPVHVLTHEFTPFTGGIGVYVEETARALAELGFPTTVWAPDYGGGSIDAFPFETRRIAMRGKQDWLCRVRMGRAIRKAFPDRRLPGRVVLAEPGPIRLWMYQRLFRLPEGGALSLVLHGSEIRTLARPAHRKALFRELLRQADRVGVVSSEVQRMVTADYPEAEARMVRVPGAVRSVWRDLPPAPIEGTGRLRQILQVGRVHPRKGQHVLVEAVARLPEALRNTLCVRLIGPVGRPAYYRKLKSRIEEQRLPIRLEGAVSEEALRQAYLDSGILVMPSRPSGNSIEGLGLAILEAAHFGCAVIGSRIGGVPDALRDGETGWLVPPDEPVALAAAIEKCLQDSGMAERFGQAGAAFVRKEFSWTANARLLTGL